MCTDIIVMIIIVVLPRSTKVRRFYPVVLYAVFFCLFTWQEIGWKEKGEEEGGKEEQVEYREKYISIVCIGSSSFFVFHNFSLNNSERVTCIKLWQHRSIDLFVKMFLLRIYVYT